MVVKVNTVPYEKMMIIFPSLQALGSCKNIKEFLQWIAHFADGLGIPNPHDFRELAI